LAGVRAAAIVAAASAGTLVGGGHQVGEQRCAEHRTGGQERARGDGAAAHVDAPVGAALLVGRLLVRTRLQRPVDGVGSASLAAQQGADRDAAGVRLGPGWDRRIAAQQIGDSEHFGRGCV
jgi:hypothetical protein